MARADFLGVLQKFVHNRSLAPSLEPFRFWFRIPGDIHNQKTTPRLAKSGSGYRESGSRYRESGSRYSNFVKIYHIIAALELYYRLKHKFSKEKEARDVMQEPQKIHLVAMSLTMKTQ